MALALAVDHVADHDERDLGDRALAPERDEIEIDHDPDDAVALSRREREVATQRVGQPELFETVGASAVPLRRRVALVVKPADALREVVFGRIRPANPGRARRDQASPTNGLVALEVGPCDGAVARSPAQSNGRRCHSRSTVRYHRQDGSEASLSVIGSGVAAADS